MKTYNVVGLMSGSSLDGLDICLAKISSHDEKYSFEIINAKTIEYPNDLYEKLKNCRTLTSIDLLRLENVLTHFFAEAIISLLNENKDIKVDFVVNHGHTVFHYPTEGITHAISNHQLLAQKLKIKVLGNLREKDVAYGGQGAPIVPVADKYLFSEYKYCLNLGGICNISEKRGNEIYSYDIGVCNQALNYYAQLLGKEYDEKGDFAKKGKIYLPLLETLNEIDFYKTKGAKSIDNGMFLNVIKPLVDQFPLSINDILATMTEHIAIQIANTLSNDNQHNLLATGGGACNQFLIERLQYQTKCEVIIPNKQIVNFKEALAMCFFGVRNIENRVNVFATVTGASQDTVSGVWFD
jgi:anhydro-N-acetylmuramic acid kinase